MANFVRQYFVFTNADAYNFQKAKQLEYITQLLFLAMIHKLIKMQIKLHEQVQIEIFVLNKFSIYK